MMNREMMIKDVNLVLKVHIKVQKDKHIVLNAQKHFQELQEMDQQLLRIV
jgi:hypothetical protein